jgi:DNA-3-methyladenine glycosylase
MKKILSKDFYTQDTVLVARQLLGKRLCVKQNDNSILTAIINETEAYKGFEDDACHGSNGKTNRNDPLFLEGGFSYIYLIYGLYHMLNIVTESNGYPSAVLVRSVIPDFINDKISYNRFEKGAQYLTSYQIKNLSNGPGKLTRALNIDLSFNKIDVTQGVGLWIETSSINNFNIIETTRVGIDYALKSRDNLWRFIADIN